MLCNLEDKAFLFISVSRQAFQGLKPPSLTLNFTCTYPGTVQARERPAFLFHQSRNGTTLMMNASAFGCMVEAA